MDLTASNPAMAADYAPTPGAVLEPGITVVVPVYNRELMARATLSSIAAQTYRPMRVVLVDNDSTDGTLAMLRQWAGSVKAPDFSVEILSESIRTAAAARRKGTEAVRTEYVMFFDSDDLMHPDHVARAMREFTAHPEADIVGWDFPLCDTGGHRLHRCRFFARSLMYHNLINGSLSTQRYAMRTSLLLAAGGWNPAIKRWNDLELGVRLALQRPAAIKSGGVPTLHTVGHPDSITGPSATEAAPDRIATLDAVETLLTSRRHRRILRLKRAILAGECRREGSREYARVQMQSLLRSEKCPFYRLLYRAASAWVACGIPGVSIAFRPFF